MRYGMVAGWWVPTLGGGGLLWGGSGRVRMLVLIGVVRRSRLAHRIDGMVRYVLVLVL
jgi:hypothetical protein